jgi:hypothetical protein
MLLSWLPGSPDLNPTENLSAILKRCTQELGPEANDELIDVIIRAGEGIEMFLVNRLTDSMLEQLEEVMKNKGGYISY